MKPEGQTSNGDPNKRVKIMITSSFGSVEGGFLGAFFFFKVSVKENEVPKEKNSSRASIFTAKASYISN